MIKKTTKLFLLPVLGVVSTPTVLLITNSNLKNKILEIPDEYFNYSDDGKTLLGFKEDVDIIKICKYNTIRIKESVKRINGYAFFGMFDGYSTNITNLYLNKNLESIGPFAFSHCSGIKYVNFDEIDDKWQEYKLKNLEENAFSYSGIGDTLIVPRCVETIGESCFECCNFVESLIIYNNNLKSIDRYAFNSCGTLSLIKLSNINNPYEKVPDWLLKPNRIFIDIGKMSSSNPGGVVELPYLPIATTQADWQSALYNKQKLPGSYIFSAKTEEIDKDFLKIDFDDDYKPSILKGFYDEFEFDPKKWYKLEIPETILTIDSEAFKDRIKNTKLTIDFSKCGAEIKESAFENCDGIVGVVKLDTCEKINKHAFKNCTNITGVSVSGSSTLGENAFENCSNLQSVSISSQIIEMKTKLFNKSGTFTNCNNIHTIDLTGIGESVPTEWKEQDFDTKPFINSCEYGELYVDPSITESDKWPDIMKNLGISDKWKISTVEEPKPYPSNLYNFTSFNNTLNGFNEEGIEKLKDYNEISIPTDTAVIRDGAFDSIFVNEENDDKEHKWNLLLNEGLKQIGQNVFNSCNGITGTLVLPNTLEKISDNAFCSNNFFGQLILPNSIKYIGDQCFSQTHIDSTLTIPSELSHIGKNAFSNTCIKKLIFSANDNLEIGNSAFAETSHLKQIDISKISLDVIETYQENQLFNQAGSEYSTNQCELIVSSEIKSKVTELKNNWFGSTAGNWKVVEQ